MEKNTITEHYNIINFNQKVASIITVEYSMDEFKQGMLLNSQPALLVISKA